MRTEAQLLKPLPPQKLPAVGNFFSWQLSDEGKTLFPPLPFNPFPEVPVYPLGKGMFLYDDRNIDYEAIRQEQAEAEAKLAEQDSQLQPMMPLSLPSTNFYFSSIDVTNGNTSLTLTNTTNTFYYQLLTKTNFNQADWDICPVAVLHNTDGTNQMFYNPVPANGRTNQYFKAQKAFVKLEVTTVSSSSVATWGTCGSTNGQDAFFRIQTDSALGDEPGVNVAEETTVLYRLSGVGSAISAVNGVDYTIDGLDATNLIGAAVMTNGAPYVDVVVHPKWDCTNPIPLDATVTVTLLQNSNYVIEPTAATATLTISNTNNFFTVVTNLYGCIDIDYDSVQTNLIASVNFYSSGGTNNFAHVNTNGTPSRWGAISNVVDEIPLTVVKSNAGGFTKGDVYFGTLTGIDKLSANGSNWIQDWAVLTNHDIPTVITGVGGGVYVDRTGIFGNDLIAVTGDNVGTPASNSVWRVNSNGVPSLLANLAALHLENVITLPNTNWGPWTGKILTADKYTYKFYAVDTNGTTATFDTTTMIPGGMSPEDFDIIPADQDLYLCDPALDSGSIMKLSHTWLANYVGDLLVTQGGEVINHPSNLFIIHWSGTNFVIRTISYPDILTSNGHIEHVTFAPMDIPSHPR